MTKDETRMTNFSLAAALDLPQGAWALRASGCNVWFARGNSRRRPFARKNIVPGVGERPLQMKLLNPSGQIDKI
jgi:hypothetical protein